MRPKSSSWTLILRSSVARIVSSSIGISYCLPVRLSVTVSVLDPVATPPPSEVCVSVVILLLSKAGGKAARSGVDDPSQWPLYYAKARHGRHLRARGARAGARGSAAGPRGAVPARRRRTLALVMAAELRAAVGPQRRAVERHERQLRDLKARVQHDRHAGEVVELERERPPPPGVAEAGGRVHDQPEAPQGALALDARHDVVRELDPFERAPEAELAR